MLANLGRHIDFLAEFFRCNLTGIEIIPRRCTLLTRNRPSCKLSVKGWFVVWKRGRIRANLPEVRAAGIQVVKEAKFFRKQADKAEQAASRLASAEVAESLRALATAYRSQADAIKRNSKDKKNKQKQR